MVARNGRTRRREECGRFPSQGNEADAGRITTQSTLSFATSQESPRTGCNFDSGGLIATTLASGLQANFEAVAQVQSQVQKN